MVGKWLHSFAEVVSVFAETSRRVARGRHFKKKQDIAFQARGALLQVPLRPVALLDRARIQFNQVESAGMGCMLGAAVGDASGALLEFGGSHDIVLSMEMPGGGVFGVAPGQVTDDSELGLCLALGLLDSGDSFSLDNVANRYHDWIRSAPFDVGQATRHAFINGRFAYEMRWSAIVHNTGSKANGSLMRCMPLAVWGHRLPREQLVHCAMLDSSLSHPNPACQIAVACYVSAASALIRGEDANTALAEAQNAIELAEKAFHEQWQITQQQCRFRHVDKASQEVRGWLEDALAGKSVPYTPQDGFIRIAFTHAFRHLAQGTALRDAMIETLAGFGDTDTNTAIVCGLLGARDGINKIPKTMWAPIISCRTELGRLRPNWLSMSQLPEVVLALVDAAPSKLRSFDYSLIDPFDDELQKKAIANCMTTEYC